MGNGMKRVSTLGFGRLAAVLFGVVLVMGLCFPSQALAYFSKPAVGVYLGSGQVSLVSGQSTTVSVSVDMWSEQQLPGCGMAECPQACSGLVNPDTGVLGGCLNDAGWCTCAGTTYFTAYTQLSVSSSNPSVARAVVSGGALSIQAYSPGTTTITVYSQLSKHQEGSSSMTVSVSAPASTDGESSSGSSGSSSGGASSGGSSSGGSSTGSSSAGSGSGSSGQSGSVSVSSVGVGATAAAAAQVESSGSQEREVVEIEAEDGTKTIVVEAKDSQTAAEELAKVAGTEGTVTFWSGGTLDAPDISWTFKGTDLSEDADLEIDPTVKITPKGEGEVAALLSEVDKAIVMDFAHSGDLPAPAEVYLRASGTYEDGQKVNLYSYDENAKKFVLEQEDIEVSSGYAVFTLDHCSIWAISQEDLASLEMPADAELEDDVDASTVNVHPQEGIPLLAVGAVVVVLVVIAVAVLAVRRRKRAAAEAAAQQKAAETLFGETGRDSFGSEEDEENED